MSRVNEYGHKGEGEAEGEAEGKPRGAKESKGAKAERKKKQ